jgi:signal transduction histidine kinase/HPt (histidine-containing phosphotransfer) domain-containing protein/ActR/RegA family two-component response regulator
VTGRDAETTALFRWVAGLQVLVAGLFILSRVASPWTASKGIHVTLNALIVGSSAIEWWWLRSRARSVPGAKAIPVLVTLTAVSSVWSMRPESALYVLMAIPLLFIRLDVRWAGLVSSGALVVTAVIFRQRWDADYVMLLRLVFSGGGLLLTVWMVRRTMDRILDQLRETSRLLRETIESVGQGVAVLDREGVVALMNGRAATMLEVPPEMQATRFTAEAFASLQVARGDLVELGESDPRLLAYVSDGRNVLAPGIPERYTRRTRDGTWLEVRTHRMPSGSIVRTWTDVTSYVDARREAERAARVRTAFLASISHEFRTPLNAILGFTRLAEAQEEREDQRERLQGVSVAATQLRQLVDGVIDLAGLDSGALTLATDPFDLDPLVHRVTAPIASRCRARGVEFQVDIASTIPARLVGDPLRLGGMVRTLAEFAERHTEQGRIGLHLDVVTEEPAGLVLRVMVRDTGRGFTPMQHAALNGVEAAPTAADASVDGGAAIAFLRRYAELMGGTLGVASEYGKGTMLWLTMRLSTEDAAASVAPLPLPPPAEHAAVPEEAPVIPAGATAGADSAPQPSPSRTPPGGFMAASQRYVEVLLDDLQVTRTQLEQFQYRAWVFSCVVAALAVALGIVIPAPVTGVIPPWLPDARVPSLLLTGWFLWMALRHRALDRAFRREAALTLVLTVLSYALVVQVNGALPTLLLAGAIVTMYIAHPRWAARLALLVMLLATAVAYPRFPAQELVFLRALSGALVSTALMEWLMAVVERIQATFGRATQALGDVSKNLVVDNARLARATAMAEDAMQRRTDLMASVSHELRTPMNAILGLGNLLLQEPLAPRQREWILRIRQNGQHLVELVNDLLDVTRIEAGKVTLDSAPFALDEVLGQAADVLERDAVAKGLGVGITVADDVPRVLRGDRRRVAQLLLNYVSNAVKYTEHGRIDLRVQAVRAAGQVYLRVEVEDTGVGLTEAQRVRLFRPFEQLEPGVTRFEGAGLGLSICKWLATAMAGEVGVTSTRGVGSTFWFTVRLEEVADAALDAQPELEALDEVTASRLARARVLVVDDNAINRIVTSEILRQAGVDVREADGGEAAVLLVQSQHPDLVLMDVQMPDVDGLEASRRIRALLGAGAPPIIAITASAVATDRTRCLDAGMVDLLEKPFEATELQVLVARWLPTGRGEEPAFRPEGPAGLSRTSGLRVTPSEALPVLDMDAGLRLLGGDRAMYERLLGMLEREQADAMPEIAEALRAGDRARARARLHALAGSCAILGAEAGHAAARELLALLAEEAPLPVCEDALIFLQGEITRLLGEIGRGLGAPEDVRAA